MVLDGQFRARVVIAADGANSMLRKAIGLPQVRRTALAIRGYTPTVEAWKGRQAIVFGATLQPSYAWAFDRGDGLSNVGYGEVLRPGTKALTKKVMLHALESLLPGSTEGGDGWLAHQLPLSSWTWPHPTGRVLLAGDAAGLVNPMTGEGIYYAVATGALAGRTAVARPTAGGDPAAAAYRSAVRALLARHLRHTDVVSRLVDVPRVVDAGLRAAAADQTFFDDLVEIGLGRGLVKGRVLRGLAAALI
jgi:flavin-dependent dehydrogenase